MTLLNQIIQRPNGASPLSLCLNAGDVIYLVGPNGAGKSALIGRIAQEMPAKSFRRISAHRQNWMSADATAYSPSQLNQQRDHVGALSQRPDARFLEHNPDAQINLLLSDLKSSERHWQSTFVEENRKSGALVTDYEKANPSPSSRLNDILRLGTITVKLDFSGPDERITGTHPGSDPIGISKLSDGERNAIIIAGSVLTAPKDHVIIIDEPERHLHHSITEPLLNSLFKQRPDCAFIISTHEITLPASTPEAQALLLRKCIWKDNEAIEFDINSIPAGSSLPFDLRYAILGSRKRILFVEGKEEKVSMDKRLYSLLFPSVSVIPKGGCRQVIEAVAGLRGADGVHWIEAFGLIDLDNRSAENVADLSSRGIFALRVCSVEALFFGSVARKALADQQAKFLKKDSRELLKAAEAAALKTLDEPGQSKRLCARRCEGTLRDMIVSQLPTATEIESGSPSIKGVDATALLKAEITEFEKLRAANDLDGLIARYQLRETGCYSQITQKLLFQKKSLYGDAVIAMLEHDPAFLAAMKKLVEPLSTALDS